MIVVDASLVLDLVARTPDLVHVGARLLRPDVDLQCPHVLDLEVANALRKLTLRGRLAAQRAREALEDLADLPLVRWPHEPLLGRIWELRNGLTAYDAAYVALAESLGAPLLTRDARLASAPGHRARIEVV